MFIKSVLLYRFSQHFFRKGASKILLKNWLKGVLVTATKVVFANLVH